MFDSLFRYGVSSFSHPNTSSRVVVFRVRLVELPVRVALLRSRLPGITSWVHLVILSVRFVVLRVRLITDHPGSSSFVVISFRSGISSFRRFIVSTRSLNEAIIPRTLHKLFLDSMHLYMKYLALICSFLTENARLILLTMFLAVMTTHYKYS